MFDHLQASLPMTRIQSRRKTVVDALVKIRESGLLGVVSNLWLGTLPRRHSNAERDDPSFLPAGIVQTKSLFVALALGQALAVMIGMAECVVVRRRNSQSKMVTKPLDLCPTCGR